MWGNWSNNIKDLNLVSWKFLRTYLSEIHKTPECERTDEQKRFYRHYEKYTDIILNLTDIDVENAFHREWSDGVRARQEKEWALKRIQDFAKQRIKMDFWLFGAKDFPAEVKAVCRSNIVERAHLTAEEERDIFEDVPYWYNRVMGTKKKKAAK